MSRPGRLGQGLDAPGGGHLRPAASGSATGRPPGSSERRARRPRPRRGHRSAAGTQATAAPVASASRATALNSARGTGQPLAGQDHRAGLTRAGRRASLAAQCVERRASPPGTVGTRRPPALIRPLVANGAQRDDRQPALQVRLAQPQEDARGLLLGLEADEHARRARPRSLA